MLRKTDSDLLARTTPELRIGGLRKRFGAMPVLDGIDLDVTKGELITVLGPSGSGKTTLLRLLCGFERADRGSIELAGRPVARGRKLHTPPERRGIGYVAQEGALFPHLSVRENLLFGLPRRIRKGRREEKARRVGDLLDLVGLPAHYAGREPQGLSGGEQQRVALARALAPDPAIILLDEPFSALDAGLRAGLRAAIAISLKRAGATALLVTHDQDEALSMSDRVAVLQNGRFAQVASPPSLYRYPANRKIARFVGDAVFAPGSARDGIAECCFGRLPIVPASRGRAGEMTGPVDVMVRPEQFRLCGPVDGADSAAPRTARVERLTFYGHDAQVVLRLDDGRPFTATAPGYDLPEPGQEVGFQVVGSTVAYPRRS
jgi:iron(III) transport system ATP-binding protein